MKYKKSENALFKTLQMQTQYGIQIINAWARSLESLVLFATERKWFCMQ